MVWGVNEQESMPWRGAVSMGARRAGSYPASLIGVRPMTTRCLCLDFCETSLLFLATPIKTFRPLRRPHFSCAGVASLCIGVLCLAALSRNCSPFHCPFRCLR